MKSRHIVPDFTIGERCTVCGEPAKHKVEDVIEHANFHPYTQYLCCVHFSILMGNSAAVTCGLERKLKDE
jgi:hypothetical protein